MSSSAIVGECVICSEEMPLHAVMHINHSGESFVNPGAPHSFCSSCIPRLERRCPICRCEFIPPAPQQEEQEEVEVIVLIESDNENDFRPSTPQYEPASSHMLDSLYHFVPAAAAAAPVIENRRFQCQHSACMNRISRQEQRFGYCSQHALKHILKQAFNSVTREQRGLRRALGIRRTSRLGCPAATDVNSHEYQYSQLQLTRHVIAEMQRSLKQADELYVELLTEIENV